MRYKFRSGAPSIIYTLQTLKEHLSKKVPMKILDLLYKHDEGHVTTFSFDTVTIMPIFKKWMTAKIEEILFLYRIHFMMEEEFATFCDHLERQVTTPEQRQSYEIQKDVYDFIRTIPSDILIEYLTMIGYPEAPFFTQWYKRFMSAPSLNHQVLSCITEVFRKYSLSTLDILMVLEKMKDILGEAGYYAILKKRTMRRLMEEVKAW